MNDRFSSREDVEFNKAAFDIGYTARMHSSSAESREINNPYKDAGYSNWLRKSYYAGWADADIDPDAPWNKTAEIEAEPQKGATR